MQLSISSICVALFAMSQLVAAVPASKQQNSVREQFKQQNCKSQACRDSVDSGCALSNINFELGGCDDPSQ
ncbi:hypothetical protein CORC01_00940 [Colletotrichum orchidophilum]|uniref:Uncharacterized protein n=1 Tax=Colletotrichum orchidophilum TaxID=1209926 RepID=A0A1G4BQ77_9PEZI|nr:uncharacterized protein CORC01_00940 [Colletotrichum orchidophilum]OHF03621.1 hypothetical protein CORC01_00940 [Colletotrichum orchidophilum]